VQGISLRPALEGRPLPERDMVGEGSQVAGRRALRTATHKFIVEKDGEEELYDYRVDPRERVNRADDPGYRDQVRDLRAAARQGCDPVPPGFSWDGGAGL